MRANSSAESLPVSKARRADFQSAGRSRLPTTAVRMRSRLVMLHPRGSYGQGVAFEVFLEEARVVLGTVLHQLHSEVVHALGDVLVAQRLCSSRLQPRDELPRRARRRLQADDRG